LTFHRDDAEVTVDLFLPVADKDCILVEGFDLEVLFFLDAFYRSVENSQDLLNDSLIF
jgi:hypothetical protein